MRDLKALERRIGKLEAAKAELWPGTHRTVSGGLHRVELEQRMARIVATEIAAGNPRLCRLLGIHCDGGTA